MFRRDSQNNQNGNVNLCYTEPVLRIFKFLKFLNISPIGFLKSVFLGKNAFIDSDKENICPVSTS